MLKTQNLQQQVIQGLSRLKTRLLVRQVVTKRERKTLAALASVIVSGCVFKAFPSTITIDWFLLVSKPMSLQWYVYFVGCALAWVLVGFVVVRLSTKGIKPFAILFFAYTIFNLVMFFVNYNSSDYYYAPLIIIAIICNKIYS